MNDVLGVIMGGGRGSRLHPLTKMRSKPAVPIAGKYRLIDIPISNCINSGIYRVAVLTQFNSVSLHRHISLAYNFDVFHSGWVQIWAAEQTPQSADWYQGTADAVRKQLFEIQATGAEYVLILAGDHLYMQRGYADKDNPGVRYNIYTIDYGAYVDLIGTTKEPILYLDSHNEPDVVVPFDDKRSIRRIVLHQNVLDTEDANR
jgi:hypothetical protein